MIAAFASFAVIEAKALFRGRTSIVFFFALPALLSAILGPAVTGLQGEGVGSGRAMLGFAVMFAFMTANYMGRSLFRDFVANTWRLNAIQDPPVPVFLAAKAASVFLVGFLQLVLFVLIGVVALDLPTSRPLWEAIGLLMVVFALHSLAGVTTAIVVFTFIKRSESYFSLMYLVLISFATLGGAIVATQALPAWSRAVGQIFPHHWTMSVVDELTVGEGRLSTVLLAIVVLTFMVALLAAVSAIRYDYRDVHYP